MEITRINAVLPFLLLDIHMLVPTFTLLQDLTLTPRANNKEGRNHSKLKMDAVKCLQGCRQGGG